MAEDLTREEIHETLDRAVGEILDSAGLSAGPIDLAILARDYFGLVLREDVNERHKGTMLSGQQILVRPGLDEESRQATIAHALAEFLRGDMLRRLGLDSQQKRGLSGPSLVGLVADRLLVPTAWLADEGRNTGWDLLALKTRFPTASYERIAWRLLDLEEPCVITIIDNDHVAKRRSNAWPVNKHLLPPEQQVQKQVHHYSRPCDRHEDGWRVQGWPVHRVDWKQEILRSVRDEM